MAESRTSRSTKNRGPMTEETYLLCEVLKGNPKGDPMVDNFEKSNLSFIHQNSYKSRPKFAIEEDTVLRIDQESPKIVHE